MQRLNGSTVAIKNHNDYYAPRICRPTLGSRKKTGVLEHLRRPSGKLRWCAGYSSRRGRIALPKI